MLYITLSLPLQRQLYNHVLLKKLKILQGIKINVDTFCKYYQMVLHTTIVIKGICLARYYYKELKELREMMTRS